MYRTIRKNKRYEIVDTKRPYDFICYIDNKSDEDIFIKGILKNKIYEYDDYIKVEKGKWIGLLADGNGRDWKNAFYKGRFEEISKDEYERSVA